MKRNSQLLYICAALAVIAWASYLIGMSFHNFNISYGLNVFLFLLGLSVGLMEAVVIGLISIQRKMNSKQIGLSILLSIVGIIPSIILVYGITHLKFS